eukprot:1159807-Pelagomonas_calceolata.AAC.1
MPYHAGPGGVVSQRLPAAVHAAADKPSFAMWTSKKEANRPPQRVLRSLWLLSCKHAAKNAAWST